VHVHVDVVGFRICGSLLKSRRRPRGARRICGCVIFPETGVNGTRLEISNRRSTLRHSYPGLTAGPIECQPFGPHEDSTRNDRPAPAPQCHLWGTARAKPAVNRSKRSALRAQFNPPVLDAASYSHVGVRRRRCSASDLFSSAASQTLRVPKHGWGLAESKLTLTPVPGFALPTGFRFRAIL
jgi:hypothetical protein